MEATFSNGDVWFVSMKTLTLADEFSNNFKSDSSRAKMHFTLLAVYLKLDLKWIFFFQIKKYKDIILNDFVTKQRKVSSLEFTWQRLQSHGLRLKLILILNLNTFLSKIGMNNKT